VQRGPSVRRDHLEREESELFQRELTPPRSPACIYVRPAPLTAPLRWADDPTPEEHPAGRDLVRRRTPRHHRLPTGPARPGIHRPLRGPRRGRRGQRGPAAHPQAGRTGRRRHGTSPRSAPGGSRTVRWMVWSAPLMAASIRFAATAGGPRRLARRGVRGWELGHGRIVVLSPVTAVPMVVLSSAERTRSPCRVQYRPGCNGRRGLESGPSSRTRSPMSGPAGSPQESVVSVAL
jgi:hypothetical protein